MRGGGGRCSHLSVKTLQIETHRIRPSSNKKLFPVRRPGGLKRAYWTLFFPILKLFLFLLFPLYILVYKKNEVKKKKEDSRPPDWLF